MDSRKLIVGGDSKYLKKTKYFKCGINKNNDLIGYDIKSSLDNLNFKIKLDKEYDVNFKNGGKHFITDILISIKIGLMYDIDINDILESIKKFKNIDHRMNIIKYKELTLIDDSYNSSYESLNGVLDLIKNIDKKKILIIGNILELGKYSKKIHKKIVKKIKKIKNANVILVGKEFNKYKNYDSVDEVIDYLDNIILNDEIILIKGSRNVKLDKIKNYIENRINL